MTGSAWADISDEAKDFVKKLLDKCVQRAENMEHDSVAQCRLMLSGR